VTANCAYPLVVTLHASDCAARFDVNNNRAFLLPLFFLSVGHAFAAEPAVLPTADLPIRDPFVVAVPETTTYCMYGTRMRKADGPGFDAYVSTDLQTWQTVSAFERPKDFWADRDFWAPEVHRFKNRWYMFASFKAPNVCRGTQILVADSPRGPFQPHSDGPVTPRDWECLDGTLFVDDAGAPWIVFCHEWLQVHDGEICATRLAPDLKAPAEKTVLLFRASDAPWPTKKKDMVTDGPFLYRAKNGHLLMLWSSFGQGGYNLGVARSASGKVTGPWTHDPEPLYRGDGGHGMLFRTFEGRLTLALHAPNGGGKERARFIPVREEDGRFVTGGP
jgi:arabinan endo-1,5-alpha-L-arabinosidase